ncbi:MAG TPA: hypothetical protein VGM88_21330 [Kofleriaceae bacterium]|jgi:hypothetical protein
MSRSHLLAFVFVAACSNSNNGSNQAAPDAAPVICGDGVCAATEVNSCQADCGIGPNSGCAGGNPDGDCQMDMGETAANCRSDCDGVQPQPDGGTNPQPDAGTNPTDGGSTTLNCQDPNTEIACILCIGGLGCTGVDETDCEACFGGGLSLCDGGAADGICESDEDDTTCPEDCPSGSTCDGGAPDGICEADEDITTCPDDCF